uniref:Uncharacterized protein n=1 Tax=Pelusios castaneus TaxID=367368 RepID=A0A8C8RRY7_9SAUR
GMDLAPRLSAGPLFSLHARTAPSTVGALLKESLTANLIHTVNLPPEFPFVPERFSCCMPRALSVKDGSQTQVCWVAVKEEKHMYHHGGQHHGGLEAWGKEEEEEEEEKRSGLAKRMDEKASDEETAQFEAEEKGVKISDSQTHLHGDSKLWKEGEERHGHRHGLPSHELKKRHHEPEGHLKSKHHGHQQEDEEEEEEEEVEEEEEEREAKDKLAEKLRELRGG